MLYGTRRLDISAEESTSATSCLPRGRRRVYGLPRTAHAAAVARSGKYQV